MKLQFLGFAILTLLALFGLWRIVLNHEVRIQKIERARTEEHGDAAARASREDKAAP